MGLAEGWNFSRPDALSGLGEYCCFWFLARMAASAFTGALGMHTLHVH